MPPCYHVSRVASRASRDSHDAQYSLLGISFHSQGSSPVPSFHAPELEAAVRSGGDSHSVGVPLSDVNDFFMCLALCHTVVPERDTPSSPIVYQAESPDEGALVQVIVTAGRHVPDCTVGSVALFLCCMPGCSLASLQGCWWRRWRSCLADDPDFCSNCLLAPDRCDPWLSVCKPYK
jgi:hypothetical protein